MKISEISLDEYRQFVRGERTDNFLQSPEMYQRYQKIGKESYLFGGFEGKKLVAVALCVKMREKLHQKVYNIPRGPILDYEAKEAESALEGFLGGIEKILRKKGGMILQISPNIFRKRQLEEDKLIEEKWPLGEKIDRVLTGLGFKNLGEYEQVKWAYVLGLSGKTVDEILMDFRYSHRRNIRLAAEKYGIKIRELGTEEIGVLKQITEQTGERRGFKDPEVKYYQDMKEAFSDKVKFLVAEWDGTGVKESEAAEIKAELAKNGGKIPVAAAMFLTYGGETIYLFSGSDRRYKKYAGPHLMQWEVIKKALEEGVEIYNFYGTHPVELPGEKGVFEFKRGFRGEFIEYVGTYAKPLNLAGRAYLMRQKYREFGELS